MKTVQTCLEAIHARFAAADLAYTHGIESAWDEAVALVLHVLALPADAGEAVLQNPVPESAWVQMAELALARIERRIPLAYLLKEAWFMQLPFYVDARVLIPRSPFGEWIARRFAPFITAPEAVKRILEIGTGSGCMAIAAALMFPQATVDAVDVSADALAVARQNIARHQVEAQVTLYHGDCYAPLPDGRQYDLIISNPPYVSAEECETLPPEFAYEPVNQALFAESSGMAVVDAILKGARERLTEAAILVVEVGFSDEIFVTHYPTLSVTWLDCEFGGQGLFLLSKAQLEAIDVGE